VRVAIITESFLPQVNGVTNSVIRVLDHLAGRGHSALVIAPGAGPQTYAGAPVVRVRSVGLPFYRTFTIGLPTRQIEAVLTAFAPDVVHLASPIALGAHGAIVAERLGIPAVAVYQTDIAAFAQRYRGLGVAHGVVWAWLRQIHGRVARTLAPSSPALWDLRRNGIPNVHLWGRGVDGEAFNPGHRSDELRKLLAPDGEAIVGYVGRLGKEKRVELLAPLADLPGTRIVVAGDGPARKALERDMPGAVFLGFQHGRDLSETFASLDVFVHPGDGETFCQAAQEALSSGVPVVAAAAGGLLDLVRHGETGLLWPPDQPDELVKAVATLVADPDRRAAMGVQAHASVSGRTWEALGDQILGHYRAVAAQQTREVLAS
jgi:phosphatidylinositol alpha 1,6-mannosyltransferase